MKKKNLLLLSLTVFSLPTAIAQVMVEDVGVVAALEHLILSQEQGKATQAMQHAQKLAKQAAQHTETIGQWNSHLQNFQRQLKYLEITRQIVHDQLRFIRQLQNATGDPRQVYDVIFNKIDREIFSKNGIVAHLSSWLIQSKSLVELENSLASLFHPLKTDLHKDETAREKIRTLEKDSERIQRREVIEKTYLAAKEVRSKTRELRKKLKMFMDDLNSQVIESKTLAELQKLGLQLAVTEKRMQSIVGIGEDLAKHLMEFKTLSDNRDTMEEELKKQVRNLDHNDAALKASQAAKKMYRDSRLVSLRLGGALSTDQNGRIHGRSSVGFNVNLR